MSLKTYGKKKNACLPVNASHQEVQTALNRCAVNETVNVTCVDGLPTRTSSTNAGWEGDLEEEERDIVSELGRF